MKAPPVKDGALGLFVIEREQPLMKLDSGRYRHHQIAKDQIEALARFEARQGFARAGQCQHFVMCSEQPRHRFGHERIVVDHQDPPASVQVVGRSITP